MNISITNLTKNSIDETVNVGILADHCNGINIVALFRRTGLDVNKCSNVLLGHNTFSSLYSTTTEK